ncbi:GtrA family protein [Cryptosporangium sp. NPDC051539]|uniref:GtrA family protein n=1 Tax=Cryptosporangium sp. NPDC051539 TaxID=3363962 RepID=UPI00378E3EB3
MNFVRRLRDRWHALIKELTKFGIIGVVNTVLDFAVWNALLSIGPIKAQVASTVVSATSSYFMNRHWTFRHRARSGLRREYLLFFVFNAIGLVITAGILAIASYGFDVGNVAALNVVKLFAIAIATVFRFWAYRRWVFLHPEDTLYEPDPARI